MNNHYLHIKNDCVNYSDGVFSGFAKLDDDKILEVVCLDRAEQFRHSKFGNYSVLSRKQREELAKRWEAAAHLPQGEYNYYFNLEDKHEIFTKYVKDLANKLGIKYELKIKK